VEIKPVSFWGQAARLTDEDHEPREALRALLKTALLPNLSVRETEGEGSWWTHSHGGGDALAFFKQPTRP
jgi:hypothetical protein